MSLQRIQTPGRWIRNCDNADLGDPCSNLQQSDWNFQPWVFDAGGFDSVYVLPNLVDGNISSISSYPDGGVYNVGGLKLDDMVYNASTGVYEKQGFTKIVPTGNYYVYIPNIPVTLTDGTACTLDFIQYYSGDVIIIVPDTSEFTIVHTNSGTFNITIDTSVGTVDWGDGNTTVYDASASSQSLSNVYSGGGPWTVKVNNTDDTSQITSVNENITYLDLSAADDLAIFDFENNTSLTSVNFASPHAATTTDVDFSGCDLTGQLDMTGFANLAGDVDLQGNPNLTFIIFPGTSGTLTSLKINDCDITNVISLGGLTLTGAFDANQNTNLTGIFFGTQTGVITKIDANRCDLANLDLSSMTSLEGEIVLWQNSNMTVLLLPVTSGVIDQFRVDGCNLSTLNISGLSALEGNFQANDNSNLTSIANPTSSGVFTQYNVKSCDITGTFDLSTLTGLGGIFSCRSNGNITAITNPTSSQTFSQYLCYSCDITGTLDLSGLTGLGGLLQLRNNSNMTSITFPTSAVSTTQLQMHLCDLGYVDITNMTFASTISFQMENNSMVVAEVNHMLVDMDNTFPGTGTGTINIAGTNAAPDGSSGGYDGTTAKANLISAGYSVTTS